MSIARTRLFDFSAKPPVGSCGNVASEPVTLAKRQAWRSVVLVTLRAAGMRSMPMRSLTRQDALDAAEHAARGRAGDRREPVDESAVGRHQIFVQVPARPGGRAELVRCPAIEWMRVRTD